MLYLAFSENMTYMMPKLKSYYVVLWYRRSPVFCHFLVSDRDSVFT